MKLIINLPSNENINIFYKAFSQLQKELVIFSIQQTRLDDNSKQKILNALINELKNQLNIKEAKQLQ